MIGFIVAFSRSPKSKTNSLLDRPSGLLLFGDRHQQLSKWRLRSDIRPRLNSGPNIFGIGRSREFMKTRISVSVQFWDQLFHSVLGLIRPKSQDPPTWLWIRVVLFRTRVGHGKTFCIKNSLQGWVLFPIFQFRFGCHWAEQYNLIHK